MYYAHACGKGRQIASSELEKLKLDEVSCDDAVNHIAKIMHRAYDEGKDKEFELEMSWIRESTGFKHSLIDRKIVKAAEEKAKSELEAESDED